MLETKARSRRKTTRKQKEHEVWFDGQTLQFPWCEDRNAVGQVERNAKWLEELIKDFAPQGMPIQPIVVVPGWFVPPTENYPTKVMNAVYLVKHLASTNGRFTSADLKGVIRRLDDQCRDLEF